MSLDFATIGLMITGIMLLSWFLASKEEPDLIGFPFIFIVVIWLTTVGFAIHCSTYGEYYIVNTWNVVEVNNVDVIVDGSRLINLNERFKRDFEKDDVIYQISEKPKHPFYFDGSWYEDSDGARKYGVID